MMDVLNVLGIIFGTFILEDPTTLAVGSLIAAKKMSFTVGFTSLVIGIFLGDLGLYALGWVFKRRIFSTTKTFIKPSTFQITLARFIPGMRTVTFMASGFEGYPLKKFLLVIFPSSIVWTLLLLFFTNQVFSILHYFPTWMTWLLGLLFMVGIVKFKMISKIVGMGVLIAVVIVHHSFISGPNRNEKLAHSLTRYCQIGLKILGIEINSDLMPSETRGKLILSNHMSYLDVICLSSLFPTTYVTSVEIKDTFGLGLICKLCGCLFTERRRSLRGPNVMEKELSEVQSVLKEGLALTLFPEGTSSNGEKLLPFKTSLIEGAIRSRADILPLVIKYEEIEKKRFSKENRDIVCWYGAMGFLPHFLKLCNSNGIKVRIFPLETLHIADFGSRNEIGARAYELMKCNFLLTPIEE